MFSTRQKNEGIILGVGSADTQNNPWNVASLSGCGRYVQCYVFVWFALCTTMSLCCSQSFRNPLAQGFLALCVVIRLQLHYDCQQTDITYIVKLLIQTHLRRQKQGKFEGFHSRDRPSSLTQIGFKSSIFSFNPCDLKILWMTSTNNTSSTLHQALYIISNPSMNSNWGYSLKPSIRVKIGDF